MASNTNNSFVSISPSVSGIDIDGIPKITAALNTYQETLKKAMMDIITIDKTLLNNAFKSSIAQAEFNAANANIKDKVVAIIKKLSLFQSALDKEVRNKYNNGVENASKTVFKSASERIK